MVRLVRSHFRANSLPVVGREIPDYFESPVSVYPHHLKKASIAIDDLDSLSYASRKHDQDFLNDLNTRVLVDGGYHGLPPRARRHHVVSSVPTGSHVSRRVVVGDDYDHHHHFGHNRGYSMPPSGHLRIGLDLSNSGHYDSYPLRDHRRLSLADTAVRHAHREVDRVQRELANQEDPYFAALKRMPIPVEKYRSVYAPRSSSVAYGGLGSFTPSSAVTSHVPSYYHHYYHREQPLSDYEDGNYYKKRSLYSPTSLVRCLTASPVVPFRSHSPSYEPYIHPHVFPTVSAMTSQPASASLRKARSSTYHGPRFYRSSSSYTLPESVGQWYYKTPHSPLENTFRYSSVPFSLPHVSSYSHVRSTSPPPSYDYAVAPQPPYHSMVYSGPGSSGLSSSNYSYSLNSSGLPPLSPSYGHHHHHYHHRRPHVGQLYGTHSPSRFTRTLYSSSTGHTAPERLAFF